MCTVYTFSNTTNDYDWKYQSYILNTLSPYLLCLLTTSNLCKQHSSTHLALLSFIHTHRNKLIQHNKLYTCQHGRSIYTVKPGLNRGLNQHCPKLANPDLQCNTFIQKS